MGNIIVLRYSLLVIVIKKNNNKEFDFPQRGANIETIRNFRKGNDHSVYIRQ